MFLELQIKDNKIFAPLKNKWLVLTPEEKVRQNYICTLVNNFGYKLEQMEQEVKVTNSQRGTGAARADVLIWKHKEDKAKRAHPIIVIECKAENVKIQKEDYFQGSNYASWCHAKFFVTTNEKETKYFKVLEDKIPDELDEIVNIPNAKDIDNERKINELLAQTKKFTRDEFQNLLFACHNVIRNNDKLSPEMAFDEISKILFMKIRFERSQEKVLFSKEKFLELKKAYEQITSGNNQIEFYQHFFEQTKTYFANDEIFEPNDTLKIREASFLQIVKLLEKYNLSDTSDDVKGIAFEEFLGKTFRGDLGQFFTPRTIVDFMVQLLNPEENELICDPCCGTGGFLIKSFEFIREKIEKQIQRKKEHIRENLIPDNFDELSEKEQNKILNQINSAYEKLNNDLNPQNEHSRLYNLSYRCIFGTDAEPRSARTAKMNMIMHGDGHGGVHHHDGLINVNGIFDNRFDVIITNPPFGARVSKDLTISKADIEIKPEKFKYYSERYGEDYVKSLEKFKTNIDKSLLDLYDTGKMTTLTEVLFVERCLNLLKAGGRMGIVLPEGFLNNSDLQKIRDFVEGKAKIILIVSIPQDVFIAAGATVKPSLVFLRKFTEEDRTTYDAIKNTATLSANEKYSQRINEIQTSLKDKKVSKEHKKVLKAEIKAIEDKIALEIKSEVKEKFDYQIPIAQVEKAGISSTGAAIDNELLDVLSEFKDYQIDNPIWENPNLNVEYSVLNDSLTRISFHDFCANYNVKSF